MIKLQVNVSGYSGKPCTLLAVIDADGLFLSKLLAFKSGSLDDDMYVVTYSPSGSSGDALFKDKDLSRAIALAFDLYSQAKIHTLDTLVNGNQIDPRSRVQVDKVTEGGRDYRLAPDITCAQVAVICASWAFDNAMRQARRDERMDEIDDMQNVSCFSI